MPITKNTVCLNSLISNWFQVSQNYSPIISSIQHETGFQNEHAAHGEIVLYATQLESISHSEGQKNKKYEYPLRKYGSKNICNELIRLFTKSTLEEAAAAIGDLRNEIAHVGRPKRWLTSLPLEQLVKISQFLQLTIIGCILTNLGVPATAIATYQDNYSPDI